MSERSVEAASGSTTGRRDVSILILLALALVVLHLLTNGQYGFHRDELGTIDSAYHLAWGYVGDPPLTPFVARLALDLVGPSLVGLRLFSGLAIASAMVLTGLIARELGGGRSAQLLAALAVATAPITLVQGALFQYVSFDYLWWVLTAYLIVRLLNSEDPRWWLGIGFVVGLGLETKYTMAFLVVGIGVGVLLTGAWRYVNSPWFWGGLALSLGVILPNLLWQVQHGFISLEFLASIHARDVQVGRTAGFLPEQLIVNAFTVTIPLWIGGLFFYLRSSAGKRFRLLGWMYVIPLGLFLVAQGRSYYLAPAYPMLFAAGSVSWERWLARFSGRGRQSVQGITGTAVLAGGIFSALLTLPIAPINSPLWNAATTLHDDFVEEVGWPDLVAAVARVDAALPADERAGVAILAGNYGEAGAIDLYGPADELPPAISGADSFWERGYGNPPPRTLIVLGFTRAEAQGLFARCDVAGQVTNPYGVLNEETKFHQEILVCRDPRQSWPILWPRLRVFQ